MRIQVELNDSGVALLARIKQATRSEGMSHRELFDNALTLLEWCVVQRENGRTIASLDENEKNYKELLMPLLQRVEKLETETVVSSAAASAV